MKAPKVFRPCGKFLALAALFAAGGLPVAPFASAVPVEEPTPAPGTVPAVNVPVAPPPAPTPAPTPRWSGVQVLRGIYAVAVSREANDAATRCATTKNVGGYAELVRLGLIVTLPAGTVVHGVRMDGFLSGVVRFQPDGTFRTLYGPMEEVCDLEELAPAARTAALPAEPARQPGPQVGYRVAKAWPAAGGGEDRAIHSRNGGEPGGVKQLGPPVGR